MGHHLIHPVERDCICPSRPPVAPHSPQCEDAFRRKFFKTWDRERDRFYGDGVMPRRQGSN